jgi:hypothetical protein
MWSTCQSSLICIKNVEGIATCARSLGIGCGGGNYCPDALISGLTIGQPSSLGVGLRPRLQVTRSRGRVTIRL